MLNTGDAKPIQLWKCVTNSYMRLFFFLTASLIGSINYRIFLLTNQQVVLMELKPVVGRCLVVKCVASCYRFIDKPLDLWRYI